MAPWRVPSIEPFAIYFCRNLVVDYIATRIGTGFLLEHGPWNRSIFALGQIKQFQV